LRAVPSVHPAIRRFLQKTLPIAASFCSNLLDKAAGLTKKQGIAAKGLASLLGVVSLMPLAFTACPQPTETEKSNEIKREFSFNINIDGTDVRGTQRCQEPFSGRVILTQLAFMDE
jgi:hypothetical protein